MEKYQELFKAAEAKLAAIDEVTDIEEVKRLTAEADKLMELAEAKKAAFESRAKLRQPVMPAPLPVDDDGGTQPAPATNRDGAVKAVYQVRYGEPGGAVKAILHELHGPDYETKRWNSWKGFAHYLRTGQGENREHLWTPAEIEQAIKAGQDVFSMKSTMVEATDTLGGYAVPADYRADVVSRMAGLTVVRANGARVVQTSRDSVELPVMTGGGSQYRDAVRVYWVDETPSAASSSATNLTMGLERVPVHTVMANTDLSRNLVEDAAFNLVDWLAGSFASALAIDEDNQFLVGDGNGKPQGILADSGISVLGTGQRVASGNASALTWDGLVSLAWKLDAQYRQRAVFIAEKATYEAISKLKDGDGQYLWRDVYGNNAAAGGGGTVRQLLGYPVLEQEGMPTIASSAYPILFGDMSGYIIVDRIGMSVERYIDGTLAATNQVRYLVRRRLGGQCLETWKFAAQYVSAS